MPLFYMSAVEHTSSITAPVNVCPVHRASFRSPHVHQGSACLQRTVVKGGLGCLSAISSTASVFWSSGSGNRGPCDRARHSFDEGSGAIMDSYGSSSSRPANGPNDREVMSQVCLWQYPAAHPGGHSLTGMHGLLPRMPTTSPHRSHILTILSTTIVARTSEGFGAGPLLSVLCTLSGCNKPCTAAGS